MKAYKTKFKAWKWQKNLPFEHAAWMAAKAQKREREEAKDTVFIYGGSKWTRERAENSVARSTKKVKNVQYMGESPKNRKETSLTYWGCQIATVTPRLATKHPEIATTRKPRKVLLQ